MRDLIYEHEIERHIKKMVRILDAYTLKMASLQETDELAIQRAFQILIEAIIGISRYYLQIKYSINVNRSREAFDELKNRGDLDQTTYQQLMKIIGFRNVLVHDYLELEFGVLLSLMKNRSYEFLIDFYEKISKEIQEFK